MAKDQNEEIAKCFDAWKYQMEESTEKFLSPFNKAFMQLTDVISNTGLDIRSVEPEASYLQCLAPSIQRPEYWNILGSSKSRNKLQEEEARKIIEGQMRSAEKDVIYGFTDGSCREIKVHVEQGHACFFRMKRGLILSNLYPQDHQSF